MTVGIVEIHECVIGALIGVELEGLAQPCKLRLQLVPVVQRWVHVDGAEVEQHGAVDVGGHFEGGLGAVAPDVHDIAAVEGNCRLENRVGGGHHPCHAPAHAEPRNADAPAVDMGVGDQEVYRRVHVGDNVQVIEVIQPL